MQRPSGGDPARETASDPALQYSPGKDWQASQRPGLRPSRGAVGPALGLAAVVLLVEYLARRVVAPAMLTVGAPVVSDMLATALAYGLLVTFTTPPPARSIAALRRVLRDIARRAASWLPWLGAAAFLGVVLTLAAVDARLWGDVRLPTFTSPASPTVLFASAALPLSIASLLLVNGVVVPVAEERLWRGLIQPDLTVAWGVVPGLLSTALLFSLKHVIVDGSLGRLLALAAGGLVLGLVARRAGGSVHRPAGWHTSALSHLIANLVATTLFIWAGAR